MNIAIQHRDPINDFRKPYFASRRSDSERMAAHEKRRAGTNRSSGKYFMVCVRGNLAYNGLYVTIC
jgi:hypothetical protein